MFDVATLFGEFACWGYPTEAEQCLLKGSERQRNLSLLRR